MAREEMLGDVVFDRQDRSGSEEQVATQMRSGFDGAGDHPVERDDFMAGGDVDVARPALVEARCPCGLGPADSPLTRCWSGIRTLSASMVLLSPMSRVGA